MHPAGHGIQDGQICRGGCNPARNAADVGSSWLPHSTTADGEIQVRVRDLLPGGPDRSGHGAIPGQRDGLTCWPDSEESLNGWAPHASVLPPPGTVTVTHDGRP